MYLLEDFLSIIMEDRLLRNSREVIRFLNLDTICPEYLINPPVLVYQTREKHGFVINLLHFIPQYNMIVVCANNKKKLQSNIKIYHFKNKVEDSFTIANGGTNVN